MKNSCPSHTEKMGRDNLSPLITDLMLIAGTLELACPQDEKEGRQEAVRQKGRAAFGSDNNDNGNSNKRNSNEGG